MTRPTTLAAVPSTKVVEKAALYLRTRSVNVVYADGLRLYATVQGSQAEPYFVRYDLPPAEDWAPEMWHCTCRAHSIGHGLPAGRACSHIVACDAIWQPQAAQTDVRATRALHAVRS